MQPHPDPGWRRLATALAGAIVGVFVGACSTPPPVTARPESHAIAGGAVTALARAAVASAPASVAGLSGVRLLPRADLALDARLALVRRAERSLDVQYYLLQDDSVGMRFLLELRAAAARGVRVRLLVDDLTTAGQDEVFAGFAAQAGVELRLFNPSRVRVGSATARLLLSPGSFTRLDHRMHNKLLVADNSVAIAGGRNMADAYFMRSSEANFIDVDVLVAGAVVPELSAAFDRHWNSEHARALSDIASVEGIVGRVRFEAAALHAADVVVPEESDASGRRAVSAQLADGKLDLAWAPVRAFADAPDKVARGDAAAFEGSVTQAALDVFAHATREVDIVSPYFIPGRRGMELIEAAARRGGRITLVTNSLGATDEPLVFAGYERHRLGLLRAGVAIDELAPDVPVRSGRFGRFGRSTSRLHAKFAVVDRRRIFIGSMNLDHRSAAINTEIALLIDDEGLSRELLALMRADRSALGYRLRLADDGSRVQWIETAADGSSIVHDRVPGEDSWRRLRGRLLLPWVGESEL